MSKMNPLHVEMINSGTDPSDINLNRCIGTTTSQALKLLSRAIQFPGEYVLSSHENEEDAQQICKRALELANAAGLRHIHLSENHKSKDAIVFEYRKQNTQPIASAPSAPSDDVYRDHW